MKIKTALFYCVLLFVSCKKNKLEQKGKDSPKADFNFTIQNPGSLPAVVDFSSTSTNATQFQWKFGDGNSSTQETAQNSYSTAKTYIVKLIVRNTYGADSIAKEVAIVDKKPKADFIFVVKNVGSLPAVVNFTSAAGYDYKWDFGDGHSSTLQNPENTFMEAKTYNVKLTLSNQYGSDNITKPVDVVLAKPTASFSFTNTNFSVLPVTVTLNNTSTGSNVSYLWTFGDGSTSTQRNPVQNYTSYGSYQIKLVVTNEAGSVSAEKSITIFPNTPQAYTDFNGNKHNLFAWQGKNVMILSRQSNLNPLTMTKWLKAMDATYEYYKASTGRVPSINSATYINNLSTIADVPSTCGAGCGYIGFTGIELQNTYFDVMYNAINNNNQYDQALFYEFGRNFWFYSKQLEYKSDDPVVTGYAIFMRFMAMESTGVTGAPFNGSIPFPAFRSNVENLIDTYLATPSLNWANTLGAGKGIPDSGLGASDLFASFCFRLRKNYGGEEFVKKLWKKVELRPEAATTQDAVDNFFIASCAAANKNLTAVFQTWKWSLSASIIKEAAKYP